jgi:hypothetical protein
MPIAKGAKGRGSITTEKSQNGLKELREAILGSGEKESDRAWPCVVIEWEDAFKEMDAAYAEDVRELYHPCNRRTIGFALHCDEKRVTLTMHDDRGFALAAAAGDCDNLITLPVGLIQKAILLKPV